jgi:HK97 family phage major capsid protein
MKRRQLQDESAKIISELDTLRSFTSDNPEEIKTAQARIDELAARSAEIEAEDRRERDLDAKLAALRTVISSDSDARGVVAPENEVKSVAAEIRSGVKAFSSAKAAAAVGGYLRQLFTGEIRAMGETSPTYDLLGAEFVVTELYNAIVNRLQYSSAALQLATVVRPAGQKISFPKVGDAAASFVAEGTATTDQNIATSSADLTLYELRASVAVSRSLIEDSPIDVAGLVAERFALAYAKKFDSVWLSGNASSPSIPGLADEIDEENTVTVDENASVTNDDLADVVGKVDETVMGTGSWVCSKAGWVDLMKLWAAQQTTMTVGGGRVVPTIFGAPVYLVKGLPEDTLAIYGDFAMATAVGLKASGLEIEAGREILMRNRQVLYVANTRFGVANHAPEFVAKLGKALGS